MDRASHQARCEQVKKKFEANGMTVADWARQHGFSVGCVYDVLRGKALGRRGEAYRVAKRLGIIKTTTTGGAI